MQRAADKYESLKGILASMGPVAVAFSGGVDSTLLLKAACDALGNDVAAVTVCTCATPARDAQAAARFCRENAIRHETINFDVFSIPEFAANAADRCYHCKKAIFARMLSFAAANGFAAVVEGSNTDDDGDYRPGRRALAELGVKSPLHDAGLSKAEIRECLRGFGIDAWRKPSAACLASRFPCGEAITAEKLERVAKAERFTASLLPEDAPLRVRSHGNIARIETTGSGMETLMEKRAAVAEALNRIGYKYVTLDLVGYRTGSMNEPSGN